MLKNLKTKVAFLIFAIGCSAAYAYPPYCNRQCWNLYKAHQYAAYQDCVDACEVRCEADPNSCPGYYY